jgi:hypothetical protein
MMNMGSEAGRLSRLAQQGNREGGMAFTAATLCGTFNPSGGGHASKSAANCRKRGNSPPGGRIAVT